MKQKPLVSIVTITYNHEKYLRETLTSIVTQEADFAIEALVADDCSTDSTRKILQDFAKQYPDIITPIYRKKNIGAISNFLDTLKRAQGKYIAVLDGDDFWTDTHKLKMQVAFMEKHPDHTITFHPTRVFFENHEHAETIWPNITDKNKFTANELLKENFIPTNSVMYRRQKYDNLSHNVMPLDWYLHCYHASFGKIGYIDEVMSAYRRHSTGVWWSSYGDKDALITKYGIPNVAMYVDLLRLYGDNTKSRAVIHRSVVRTLSDIVDVDDRNKSGILSKLLVDYGESADLFLRGYDLTVKDRDQSIVKKDQEIERLNQDILDLRGQVFRLKDELHMLRTSRLIGKVIKSREYLGDILPKIKGLPKRLVRKIISIMTGLIPKSIRNLLRKIKYSTGRSWRSYLRKRILVEEVRNDVWEPPVVTVVIPYYNRANTIDDTLDSLAKQTYRNFEVLIVDDGSTETDSIQKIKQLKRLSAQYRVVSQPNQGVAVARNHGIKLAKGKYVICLDSDDMIEPTFIEKAVICLEINPNAAFVTTNRKDFGVINEEYHYSPYNPIHLFNDNMVITAAMFRKEAWKTTEGYKSGIGYEDWEYWLELAEKGQFGMSLPETLFTYRTSLQSRFVEDKDLHWKNIKKIHELHKGYKKRLKRIVKQKKLRTQITSISSAFVNLRDPRHYTRGKLDGRNILITIPWMTFGGAETHIYNYASELKGAYDLTFVTGLESKHEWEYKFREITPRIYHLHNMFKNNPDLYLEFVSNYIHTRQIDILHIIHNGFTFSMLPVLKKRHPNLRVIVTLFNVEVPEFVRDAIDYEKYIDLFTSEHEGVTAWLQQQMPSSTAKFSVTGNGVDSHNIFHPAYFNREEQRDALGIAKNEIAVFLIGRMSAEKNPDIFVKTALAFSNQPKYRHVKFFMIGDGPLQGQFAKMAKDVNNLELLGYQSDVARYLSAADIYMLPSSIEGFPNGLLEAMAMNVAVVASNVGAIPKILDGGNAGKLVSAGSLKENITALEELVKDDKIRNALTKRARARIEKNYTTRALAQNYRAQYEDVLKD